MLWARGMIIFQNTSGTARMDIKMQFPRVRHAVVSLQSPGQREDVPGKWARLTPKGLAATSVTGAVTRSAPA